MQENSVLAPQGPPERRTTNGPRSIHPAIKKVWLFSGIVGAFVLGLGLFGGSLPFVFLLWKKSDSSVPAIAILVLVAVLWIGLFVLSIAKIQKQWQNWTYEVREHDLVLTWGVFWRTRRHVARDRIQHLDINSGPLDRRFGLVQVGVHTAGAAGTVGVIPGLTPEEAEDLRDMILEAQSDHV